MNVKEFFKKAGGYIIAFFAGIISFIFAGHLLQGRRSSDARNDIEQSRELNKRAEDKTKSAESTVNELRRNTEELSDNVEQCRNIIAAARKRAAKK